MYPYPRRRTSPESFRFTVTPLALLSEDLRSFSVCYCWCYHPEWPCRQISRKSFLNLLCLHHLLSFFFSNSQRTQHKASGHLSVWDFKHFLFTDHGGAWEEASKKAAWWSSNPELWSLSATSEAALLLPRLMVSTATHRASKSNMAAGDVWLLTGS